MSILERLADRSRRLEQRILKTVKLLHARGCTKGTGCPHFQWCGYMKELSEHIATCREGRKCPIKNCVLAKALLQHFFKCDQKHFCRVCSRVHGRVKFNKTTHAYELVSLTAPETKSLQVYPFSSRIDVVANADLDLLFYDGVVKVDLVTQRAGRKHEQPLKFMHLFEHDSKSLPNPRFADSLPWTVTVYVREPVGTGNETAEALASSNIGSSSSNSVHRSVTTSQTQLTSYRFRVQMIETIIGGQGQQGFLLHGTKLSLLDPRHPNVIRTTVHAEPEGVAALRQSIEVPQDQQRLFEMVEKLFFPETDARPVGSSQLQLLLRGTTRMNPKDTLQSCSFFTSTGHQATFNISTLTPVLVARGFTNPQSATKQAGSPKSKGQNNRPNQTPSQTQTSNENPAVPSRSTPSQSSHREKQLRQFGDVMLENFVVTATSFQGTEGNGTLYRWLRFAPLVLVFVSLSV